MVTIDMLKSWNADQLGRVADELHSRRGALTDLADEVTAGRPPASWIGGASVYAEQDHDELANRLTDQVAELNMVISAIDTAGGAVRSAREALDDALARAAGNDCTVSGDGVVQSNRTTFDDEDERDDVQQVVDEIAEAIRDALTAAADADNELAASLRSAGSEDVDAGGTLGDQTLPDALRGLSTDEQVDYLLDHPDLAGVMIPNLPEALKDDLGRGLSDLVDSRVNDPEALIDEDEAIRLSEIIDAYGGDPDVASSLFTDLGAGGTIASMHSLEEKLRLGGDSPEVLDLAEDLRRTLGVASHDSEFDDEDFGRDLVRHATGSVDGEQLDDYDERYPNVTGANGAAVLTFLLGNHSLDGELVESAAVELDDFERNGDEHRVSRWYEGVPLGHLTEGFSQTDAMAAALGNLGSHPDHAYSFLTDDPARQDHYFHERSWEADGFEGVTQLVEGLGTDADIAEDHPQEQAEIVSRFLHGIATNESFSVENAQPGSPHLAELLKHYTPAVDHTLLNPSSAGDPGVHAFEALGLGNLQDQPRILNGDLNELMQVAVSTEDGAISIAEGIGAYQQSQINGLAAELALNPDDEGLRGNMRGVLENTSALRGFAEYSVGTVDIAEAEARDARVQAFSDLVGEAAGLVPLPGAGLAGEAVSFAWEQGVSLGTDALTEAYGSSADAETATANERAAVGATHAKVDGLLALVEAGVVPESALQDRWFDESGDLISRSDIPADQMSSYASEAIGNMDGIATDHDISEAYKDAFKTYYGDGG